ncbi:MAG: hypothetical protein IKN43_08480 [Selenomonadaceae bacterium]|nr:hypothetical protein [Selenomonadaceae bacterium]
MSNITNEERLRRYCERNNILLRHLAAALDCCLPTVYAWRTGKRPYPYERLEALERAKREAGEWPIPGPTQEERRKAACRARCAEARKHVTAETYKKISETLFKQRHNTRYYACQRNFAEIAAAELASCGRRLGWPTFYQQSRRRWDDNGGKGFVFEGREQVYYFE